MSSRSENKKPVSTVLYTYSILALSSLLTPTPSSPDLLIPPETPIPLPQPAIVTDKGEKGQSRSTGLNPYAIPF